MVNSESLKVVFNATSLRPGGGLTVLLGILQGLAEQDHIDLNATVVCSVKETAEAIEKQGVADVVLKCEGYPVWRRQAWVSFSLGKFVNQLTPDVFLSINQFVGGVKCPQAVYHLNLLRFMPVDPTAPLIHRLADWIRNRSAKQAIEKAEYNVFESQYLLDKATEVYGKPRRHSDVVYIGLPDRLIEESKKHVDLAPGFHEGQVMAITNHNEHKDNPTLMRVLASLVEQYPNVDWKLKIAGSIFPEKWEPFKALAKELQVDHRIDWLGFVSQDELTDHLRESLCLVSTSRVESFCMVALEAMARGCPAIVANATAMPESVGDAAVLVKAGDHEGFAEAIATLQEEKEVRSDFVQFGFEQIGEFSWSRCGEAFADLMVQLKAERG